MAARKKPSTAPRRTQKKPASPAKKPIRREVAAAVCFFLAFFSFLGLAGVDAPVITAVAVFAKWILGWGFYALPFALLCCSVILFFHRGRPVVLRVWCVFLSNILVSALAHMFWCTQEYPWTWKFWEMLGAMAKDGANYLSGGLAGGFVSQTFSTLLSKIGAGFVLFLGLFFLVLTACNLSVAALYDYFKRERAVYEPQPVPESAPAPAPKAPKAKRPSKMSPIDIPLEAELPPPAEEPLKPKKEPLFSGTPRVKTPVQVAAELEEAPPPPPPVPTPEPVPVVVDEPVKPQPKKDKTPIEVPDIDTTLTKEQTDYQFPPISLLKRGSKGGNVGTAEELHQSEEQLVSTIKSFGIEVRLVESVQGPAVTRYELEMDTGIKLSRLTGLADDIALRLGASSVRIAPVPGKGSVVGVEIPNRRRATVALRDVIESAEFKNHSSKVAFAVGKDITGKVIVGDIAKLPHLLIGGTTGSGKSVFTNSLILSLLYRATPEEVRLILIDPKIVEFEAYNGIPHLLIPVVTDPKKAAGALQWAVTEMMRRYKVFANSNVRDMDSYNALVTRQPDLGDKMPKIVIVIDELADLMMVAAKDVEEAICRIAQMARAAGMHLIIATQRPDSTIITGLMKANIPSRVALTVMGAVNSRIILDMLGAEKLVGKGDMLYMPLGFTKPLRVQGNYVDESERDQVVDFLKKNAETDYQEDIIEQIERQAESKQSGGIGGASPTGDEEADELLPQAVDVILEAGQASTSMLQRRLKLGYSRASRLLDQLEERGFVGPFEGSKPRQVMVTKAQWDEMKINGETVVGAAAPPASDPVPDELADLPPEY